MKFNVNDIVSVQPSYNGQIFYGTILKIEITKDGTRYFVSFLPNDEVSLLSYLEKSLNRVYITTVPPSS